MSLPTSETARQRTLDTLFDEVELMFRHIAVFRSILFHTPSDLTNKVVFTQISALALWYIVSFALLCKKFGGLSACKEKNTLYYFLLSPFFRLSFCCH